MAGDPYKVLGVSQNAKQDDIRKAYRALAKKYHPDLNVEDKTAAERFKEISVAYDIVGDPDKRKRFDAGEIDAEGHERPERAFYRQYAEGDGGAKYWRGGAGGPFAGGSSESVEDILSDLFGFSGRAGQGPGSGRMRMRGADAHYALDVGFLDAASGARQRITLPGGETLEVALPAGVADGQTLRLKGKGNPGIGGGPAGDALVTVRVIPHPDYERKGQDIYADVAVALDEAVLGTKIDVETIGGALTVTIPAGSNTGTTLRLKGRGIAKPGGAPGDHYVRLKVVLPKTPDDELRAFLTRWQEKHRYDPRKGS